MSEGLVIGARWLPRSAAKDTTYKTGEKETLRFPFALAAKAA